MKSLMQSGLVTRQTLYERLLDTEDNLLSGMDENMVLDMLGTLYDTQYIYGVEIKQDGIYIDGKLFTSKEGREKIKHAHSLIIPGITIKYVEGVCNYGKSDIYTLEGAPEIVKGDFQCTYCENLKSLKGAPEIVKGNFFCFGCDNLKSLEGAPKIIEGTFDCDSCKNLKSLKGGPEEVKKEFLCKYTAIKTLEGAPKKVQGNFECNQCSKLVSLKGVPREVGGSIIARYCNELKSINDASSSKIGGKIYVSDLSQIEDLYKFTGKISE